MHDLLVIGAGLTGLVAALTAAEAGLRVRVVAKGMGALHWSAGTIDVLGYTSQGTPVEHPFAGLESLPSGHPYHRIGAEQVRESLAWFQRAAAAGGVEYAVPTSDGTNADANVWLPSPAGAKRPAYLAPEAQIPGDLGQFAPIVVVGLDGMRDFYPELIASNIAKQGVSARAAHVPVSAITQRTDFNTVHLAEELERPETRRRLASRLAEIAGHGERIGVPAILGLDHHAAVMVEVRKEAGAALFEIPTLPPSVPGIRLHRALCRRLDALGVRVEVGMDVIDYHAQDGEIQWVATETSSRPLRHRASRFLLATGGILGGGFTGDAGGHLSEDVFDLRLIAPENRSAWFRSEFLDPHGQPIFQAGVEVNDDFQPVDASGEVAFPNLWAAGGLLAHTDGIRERSLEGLAIASGRAAALALLDTAKTTTQAI